MQISQYLILHLPGTAAPRHVVGREVEGRLSVGWHRPGCTLIPKPKACSVILDPTLKDITGQLVRSREASPPPLLSSSGRRNRGSTASAGSPTTQEPARVSQPSISTRVAAGIARISPSAADTR